MEIYSHKEISSLVSIEGNQTCFDCGDSNPKWVSLNNGVFLCLKCAGVHRNFGLEVSIIRSLEIDSWDDKQILFLKKGGNSKYREMLREYDLDNGDIGSKYKTKAADYYRKQLGYEVEKEINPSCEINEICKPEIMKGKEMLKEKEMQDEIRNDDIIGSKEEGNEIEKEGSWFGLFGGVMKRVGEMELGSKIYDVGIGVVDFAKRTGLYVAEKTQQVYGIVNKAEEGINVVIDKTKEYLDEDSKNEGEDVNGMMPSEIRVDKKK